MQFGWSIVYLILTFLVLGISRFRGEVPRDCSVALLVWYCLANIGYAEGEIEDLSTQFNAMVFIAICVWLMYRYPHWLPKYLFGAGVAMILWTAYTSNYSDGDPYVYKLVKNGIYMSELLAVSISWKGARL